MTGVLRDSVGSCFHSVPARASSPAPAGAPTGTPRTPRLSHLIAHLLESSGERVGLMSTAENRAAGRPLADSGRFTTPEAPEGQSMLAEMGGAGRGFAGLGAAPPR